MQNSVYQAYHKFRLKYYTQDIKATESVQCSFTKNNYLASSTRHIPSTYSVYYTYLLGITTPTYYLILPLYYLGLHTEL